jgi:hypothetical protein
LTTRREAVILARFVHPADSGSDRQDMIQQVLRMTIPVVLAAWWVKPSWPLENLNQS